MSFDEKNKTFVVLCGLVIASAGTSAGCSLFGAGKKELDGSETIF